MYPIAKLRLKSYEKDREKLEIEHNRFKYNVMRVEELMEKLPQDERAIIELVYTNKIPGYDKKQIGALFGMSPQQLIRGQLAIEYEERLKNI